MKVETKAVLHEWLALILLMAGCWIRWGRGDMATGAMFVGLAAYAKGISLSYRVKGR